jgi:S1-C subfamily serine protease
MNKNWVAPLAMVGIWAVAMAMITWAPRHSAEVEVFSIAPQVEMVRPAVVHVSKHGVCQGSGCLLSPDGIMFTAKHVSDDTPGEYTITLDDGREFTTKYVIEDTENDVTFMQLDLDGAEPNLPSAELATEDTLRVGDFVFIMGSPLGKDNINSVSLGILSAMDRDLYNRRGWEPYQQYNWHVMIQTTSPAYPGNSGGPVFSLDGKVVGVLVAGEDAALNFSVPVARFRDTIETVRDWFRLQRFHVVDAPVLVEPEPEYESWSHSYQ